MKKKSILSISLFIAFLFFILLMLLKDQRRASELFARGLKAVVISYHEGNKGI